MQREEHMLGELHAYRYCGANLQYALVVSHGIGAHGGIYAVSCTHHAAKGADIWSYSAPGHGQSTTTRPRGQWTMTEWTAASVAYAEHVKAKTGLPVFTLGSSLGAAAAFAALHSDAITGAVLEMRSGPWRSDRGRELVTQLGRAIFRGRRHLRSQTHLKERSMARTNGLHHLAISTGSMKAQIAFFSDVLGMELVALYWMHGVEGTWHGFLRLNDTASIALVQNDKIVATKPAIGVSHAGSPTLPSAPGTMQHVAFNVDSDEDLLNMRDRIRSRGLNVIGPLDHGLCKSIHFCRS